MTVMIIALLILGLVGLDGSTGQNQGSCPFGFEQHGTYCYKAVNAKASWIEAKMYCRVFGGELAAIESQAEEAIVEGLLRKLHATSTPLPIEGFWIDATDLLKEGVWRWMDIDGGSRNITGYRYFYPGEPNGADTESCLHMYYNEGLHWNDYQCDQKQRFVCKAGL